MDFNVTCRLKEIWEVGSREPILLDFSSYNDPTTVCQHFWYLLHSYRRTVRRHKLNPLYTKEWGRMLQTQMKRLDMSKIYLHPLELRFCTRLYNYKTKLPEITLNFPTSLQGGTNGF